MNFIRMFAVKVYCMDYLAGKKRWLIY